MHANASVGACQQHVASYGKSFRLSGGAQSRKSAGKRTLCDSQPTSKSGSVSQSWISLTLNSTRTCHFSSTPFRARRAEAADEEGTEGEISGEQGILAGILEASSGSAGTIQERQELRTNDDGLGAVGSLRSGCLRDCVVEEIGEDPRRERWCN
jgi:hypothetical protein